MLQVRVDDSDFAQPRDFEPGGPTTEEPDSMDKRRVAVLLSLTVVALFFHDQAFAQNDERRTWLLGGGGLDTRLEEPSFLVAVGGVGHSWGFEVGGQLITVADATLTDIYFDGLYRVVTESGFELYPMAGAGFARVTLDMAQANTFELNFGVQGMFWWDSGWGAGVRFQYFTAVEEGSEGRPILQGIVGYTFGG